MSDITVKTGAGDDVKMTTVQYDIPETLQGLVDKYGDEQVTALAERAITLAVQALVRQKLAANANDAEIQNAVNNWQPGVRGAITKKTPFERAQSALGAMSKEELHALLEKVKAAAKAA